ncbi:MAG: prepilin-type N-terminal cleavage/methylation domain-containing protein [Cellvibrionaceae bacterium]
MIKILDTSLLSKMASLKGEEGFTLLEMLVVMTLLGFLISLAFPQVQKVYNSVALNAVKKEIKLTLSNLPYYAREEGTSIYLTDSLSVEEGFPVALAETLSGLGAKLVPRENILITAAGFCPLGGVVDVHYKTQVFQISLEPPSCRVE